MYSIQYIYCCRFSGVFRGPGWWWLVVVGWLGVLPYYTVLYKLSCDYMILLRMVLFYTTLHPITITVYTTYQSPCRSVVSQLSVSCHTVDYYRITSLATVVQLALRAPLSTVHVSLPVRTLFLWSPLFQMRTIPFWGLQPDNHPIPIIPAGGCIDSKYDRYISCSQ